MMTYDDLSYHVKSANTGSGSGWLRIFMNHFVEKPLPGFNNSLNQTVFYLTMNTNSNGVRAC